MILMYHMMRGFVILAGPYMVTDKPPPSNDTKGNIRYGNNHHIW